MRKAGKLRHRITIEQPVTTRDGIGGVVRGWATFMTVWAEVVPLSGREFLAAQATQSSVNARITIRYVHGVTDLMRVIHREQVYSIHAVLPDPTFREHLTLMCETGVEHE